MRLPKVYFLLVLFLGLGILIACYCFGNPSAGLYPLAWIIVAVIVLSLIIWLRAFVSQNEADDTEAKPKSDSEHPQQYDSPPSYTQRNERCVYAFGQDYSLEEYEYWSKALNYICEFVDRKDYLSAGELVINVLNDKDNKKYACELYRLIDNAIYYLYPLREEGNCKEVIFDIAYRGLNLIDDYIEQSKGYLTWRYPTKLVIMLEKEGRIEEAIELCDFFSSRGVRDTGYESFEARKNKLQRKLSRGTR